MKNFNEQEQEIYNFLLKSGATLEEVIDVVINSNGLVGVGLVTLGNDIKAHVDSHITYRGDLQ